MRKQNRSSGFTLVELLVVIGIIAVMIAMLMPALKRARESAQAVQCLSNLKQIGNMFAMYVSENNGWLPPVNSQQNGAGGGYNPSAVNKLAYGMPHALGPYHGKRDWANITPATPMHIPFNFGAIKAEFARSIFTCPTYFNLVSDVEAYKSGLAESTYLQTPRGWGGGVNTAWARPRRFSQAKPHASRIHVADSFRNWHLGDVATVRSLQPQQEFDLYRHRKGANILFADGHASWYRFDAIGSGTTTDFRLE